MCIVYIVYIGLGSAVLPFLIKEVCVCVRACVRVCVRKCLYLLCLGALGPFYMVEWACCVGTIPT